MNTDDDSRQPPHAAPVSAHTPQPGNAPALVLIGELVLAAWHIELQLHELAHRLGAHADGQNATEALARIEHQLRDSALPDWMPGSEAIVRCLDEASGCLAERKVLITALSTKRAAHNFSPLLHPTRHANAATVAVVRDRCLRSADRIEHMVSRVTPLTEQSLDSANERASTTVISTAVTV